MGPEKKEDKSAEGKPEQVDEKPEKEEDKSAEGKPKEVDEKPKEEKRDGEEEKSTAKNLEGMSTKDSLRKKIDAFYRRRQKNNIEEGEKEEGEEDKSTEGKPEQVELIKDSSKRKTANWLNGDAEEIKEKIHKKVANYFKKKEDETPG